MTEAARAAQMLKIAAEMIRDHAAYETVFYDAAECDGTCVADDCEAAAESILSESQARDERIARLPENRP